MHLPEKKTKKTTTKKKKKKKKKKKTAALSYHYNAVLLIAYILKFLVISTLLQRANDHDVKMFKHTRNGHLFHVSVANLDGLKAGNICLTRKGGMLGHASPFISCVFWSRLIQRHKQIMVFSVWYANCLWQVSSTWYLLHSKYKFTVSL